MNRSAGTVSGVATAAVLAVAGFAGVLWWAPSQGRLTQLDAAAGLIIPTLAIAGYFALIGLAVVVWVPGARGSSAGFVIGIGAAMSSVIVVFTYQVTGNATVVVGLLAMAGAVSVVVGIIVLARRAQRNSVPLLFRFVGSAKDLFVRSGDLVALALAGAVMFTVGRFGAAGWTWQINDFHRYAGSAMVWLSDSGIGADFAEKFPSGYGSAMIARADYEKPGATAMLLIASQVTGLEPYELLTPLLVVLLLVLVSCLGVALRRGFGLGLPASLACAIPPTLSLIPLSRVFDAQIGQLAAAALLATLLALISVVQPSTAVRALLARGSLAGVVVSSAIAVNATLVLSVSPIIVLVAGWIAARIGWKRSAIARFAVATAAAAILVSLPSLLGYTRTLREQTGGSEGIDIPFPFPLALVGIQPDLEGSTTVPFAWAALLAVGVVWLVLRRPRGIDAWFGLATLVASILIVSCLGLVFGFDNYSVHKWLGLWISLIAPVLLGAAVVHLTSKARVAVTLTLALAGVAALMVASNFGYRVGNVVSTDVFALTESDQLRDVHDLNVDLSNTYLNALTPLAMPSTHVRVVDTTYSQADAPVGNDFLISPQSIGQRQWYDVQPVGGDLSLAQLDLSLGAGTIDFAVGDPGANHLFGSWFASEPWGSWSAPGRSMIVFDVADDLRGKDVTIVLDGRLMASGSDPGSVEIALYDNPGRNLTAETEATKRVTLTVPYDEIVEHEGRIVVMLTSSQLVFGLRSMTLSAASD